jgi:hypothetical protein
MTAPQSASRKPKQLDAGNFQPEISSFRLHRRRGQGRQDDTHLHRGGAVVRRCPPVGGDRACRLAR